MGNEINIRVYKDKDIIKMEEILRVNSRHVLPHEVRNLLIEYHNAISIGICPNFVIKYNEKIAELNNE